MKRLQVIVLALVALPAVSPATEAALPDLSSPDRWKAFGTERVAVTVKADPGKVRMDFDFGGTAGYALARKDVPLDLPKSWHLSFRLHGTGRRNDLELKLVAREGGSGTIWLEGLAIASSSASGAGPERLWAQPPSAWHSDPSARGPVMLTLDLRERREWGGLVLFGSGTGRGFGLSRVSVEPVSFGASLNGLFTRIAAASPRGHWPRYLLQEQAPWTLIGTDGGAEKGLLSADGALVTWADVASDFLRAVLDMFAFERPADRALVVGAGVPESWLKGAPEGVEIRGLRTPYGPLSYRLYERDGALTLSIREGTRIPPGGVVFSFPPFAAGASVTVDGAAARAAGNEVVIRRLPAEVVVRNAAARKEKER